MKRFAGLLVAMAALLCTGALADTVGVRSGEHGGFTRLVIDFGEPGDWDFGRVDGGFEFRSARRDTAYRLDRVFDKIGRTRIEDVRDLGEGRLLLGVSCDCHAEVEELANGKIVLDIATGAAPAPNTGLDAELPPFEPRQENQETAATGPSVDPVTAAEPAPTRAFVSDRAGLPLMLAQAQPDLELPGITAERAPEELVAPARDGATDTAPGQENATSVSDTPQAVPSDSTGGGERAARIAKTEAALLEQLARAAAQGLLDADLSDIEENVARTKPQPVDAAAPPVMERPSPPVAYNGHVTVETSVDRATAGSARSGGETDKGDACIDPAFFDIGSWGDETEMGADLGAYRSRFVSELDVADGAGVSALVRNYIYISFGAEAKALIRRYPETLERPDLLFIMAEIMDDGWSENAPALVDQMTCDGATALWATLAQPEIGAGQALNREGVSVAFNALPAHLRRHLGPKLADALLKAGDLETADMIRSAIDRAGVTPTSEYGMLTAQFQLQAGQVEEAAEVLDDVVAAGDAELPEALLQRVEATLARGGAVADDVLVLLDSLAFQFRGTDTAQQMVDAGIRARASAGEFGAAFEQLEAAADAGLLAPDRREALREGLFDRAAQDTNDTEFLRLVLPRLEGAFDLPAETRRALARRLLALGFTAPARQALGGGNAIPDPADRLLLARAALDENRPAVAIGYLAGLTDPAALDLRAEALEKAGDHPGAVRAYEAAGEPEQMLRSAWRGGLWSEVTRLDQGPIGSAAQLMVDDPVPGRRRVADDGQPTLALAQSLIDESKAARQTLDALLEDIVSPADDGLSEGVPAF